MGLYIKRSHNHGALAAAPSLDELMSPHFHASRRRQKDMGPLIIPVQFAGLMWAEWEVVGFRIRMYLGMIILESGAWLLLNCCLIGVE
ncbi:hypothetical protein JTE90_027422 [Oedothorax gibbosus]|uniref:Uncharacterized protein n=1 Tax=Oedothorax gibbosus TaxID=931172 RepID=A0AAV6W4N9_9ARAC|nr:hypothetical protein JTE90_027422 [Oedothorax gibbosus]